MKGSIKYIRLRLFRQSDPQRALMKSNNNELLLKLNLRTYSLTITELNAQWINEAYGIINYVFVLQKLFIHEVNHDDRAMRSVYNLTLLYGEKESSQKCIKIS